jgi:hypothetical protein
MKTTRKILLTALGVLGMLNAQTESQTRPPTNQIEQTRRRLTEKIERVKKVAQQWAASGRDPSAISRTMEQKFKPLMEEGRVADAEAELDRLLEQLERDGRIANPPAVHGEAVSQPVPEEARRQMRHRLDSSFVVFRDKVQEELKLTKEQESKLEQVLPEVMQFFEKINGLTPEEQEKEIRAYRPQAHERLAAVTEATLNEGQRARLRQIELQRDQLFGAGIWKELQITGEQQKQFMALIQENQLKITTAMGDLQKGSNLAEIQSKVLKIRADLERQLEALLTDAQKQQWKEMLGKPMDVADIFDM